MPFESIPYLKGKRVLITGASNETGPHVARVFAELGPELALTYHSDKSAAERVARECEQAGAAKTRVFPLDLLDATQCRSLISKAVKAMGGLDVLIAIAGAGGSYQSLLKIDSDDLLQAFQGQVAGNFVLARDAGLAMPADGTGRIVLISAASCYKFSHATYGYAKAALNQLTSFLAWELSSRRVTVNTLVPQLIDLESIDPATKDKRRKFTPMGNIPHPEQIGRMCLTLCSPLFDTVTGQLIFMDGGYRLRPPEDR